MPCCRARVRLKAPILTDLAQVRDLERELEPPTVEKRVRVAVAAAATLASVLAVLELAPAVPGR